MRKTITAVAALVAAVGLAAPVAEAAEATAIAVDQGPLDMGTVHFTGKASMHLSIGAGSGAYRDPRAPAGTFFTVTDRGPNVKCADTEVLAGIPIDQACDGVKAAKFFPVPDFAPMIMEWRVADGKAEVLRAIPLKGADGRPITGLSNPLRATDTEGAYSSVGTALGMDPSGLDSEALVRLADGSFWLAEEYAPSLVHVAADGRIVERLVPEGLENDLANARYKVTGALPAILMKRKLNRGIESIAVSDDGKALYFAVQSPLSNPDSKAYKASNAVRLFKMDLGTRRLAGEWVYPMDIPATFHADNAKKPRKQNDVKVSEMTWLSGDRLLVLERISKTTKFYVVDLAGNATNILGTTWDDPKTAPSLEQLDGMVGNGIAVLAKSLALDTDSLKSAPSKIEGIALDGDRAMYLINDNDFGIGGAKTEIIHVTLDRPLR